VGEEPYLLDGVADLAPELRPAHRGVLLAVDEDLARRRLDEPVDHPHARRLAATRRPDQTQISPSSMLNVRSFTTGLSDPAYVLLTPLNSIIARSYVSVRGIASHGLFSSSVPS
jgi:hypothetical protein